MALPKKPNPNRSLTRQLAERWPDVEQARLYGWSWEDIHRYLAEDGLTFASTSSLRKAATRAKNLYQDGKVARQSTSNKIPSRIRNNRDDDSFTF